MDWSNMTFIAGTVVAMIVKQLWLKDDTQTRDKVVPIIVFIANLMARTAQELGGPAAVPTEGADAGNTLLLAAWYDAGVFRLPLVAAMDSLMSMGLHRAKRWRDNVAGWKPARKK